MAALLPSGSVHMFGKLPSHGDFISRGLSAAHRNALDRWLSGGLDIACAAFGPAFADLYDQAPVWRFAAMEDDRAVAGVLAPSIDRAGRRFPLYLAVSSITRGSVVSAIEWCEALIRDAFYAGWDADQLAEKVAGFVPGPDEVPAVDLPCWWVVDGEGAIAGHIADRWPERLLSIMLQPQEEY